MRSPGPTPSTRQRSTTGEIQSAIDWSALSPRARAILVLIAEPISCGYSADEVARALGKPAPWIGQQLRRLRGELQAQLEPPD